MFAMHRFMHKDYDTYVGPPPETERLDLKR